MAEGDKRHAPTERRLRQAAEAGDVQRSTDLPRAAVVVLVTLLGLSGAAGIGQQFQLLMSGWLAQAGVSPAGVAGSWALAAGTRLAPLLMLLAACAAGSSFLSGGWVFSGQQLLPNFSKILPQAGLGQVFSRHGLMETLKSILKFSVIGGVGFYMIYLRAADFAALAGQLDGGMLVRMCLQVVAAICVVLAILATADFGIQFWLHRQKLRMTDNEMRDEMKESVGNPQVKQRQRALARQMARARQMKRIPEASVIVTNPTHYAVAIRYRRGSDRAPLMLAKGVGLLAAEIVAQARGLGIPVVEAPPLARAMYRHVEPGDHVPVALYRACAEVLAYVWKMQAWRSAGGKRPAPPKVKELTPLEMGGLKGWYGGAVQE
jgi:flagellar biosynthetic protein FlhB